MASIKYGLIDVNVYAHENGKYNVSCCSHASEDGDEEPERYGDRQVFQNKVEATSEARQMADYLYEYKIAKRVVVYDDEFGGDVYVREAGGRHS